MKRLNLARLRVVMVCCSSLSVDNFKKSNSNLAISSLVIAIQMINTYTKKLKYRRKIILVTNGEGRISSEGLDKIVDKLKSDNIELVVLCVVR